MSKVSQRLNEKIIGPVGLINMNITELCIGLFLPIPAISAPINRTSVSHIKSSSECLPFSAHSLLLNYFFSKITFIISS